MTTTTTPPSSSKILITGGAGFIGSNLVDHFLEQGHTVICLDNFSTGKRENLAEAMTHPTFTLLEGDIRNLFGKRQDPNGAYAAVIPLWVQKMINLEPPVINGDGTYSRDFTYVDNVVQANENLYLYC